MTELIQKSINTQTKFRDTISKYESFMNSVESIGLRIYDIAKKLKYSEAELLSTQLGTKLKYLKINNAFDFFNEIKKLKKVMFLTRNNDVVHEKIVICKKLDYINGRNFVIRYNKEPLVLFNENLWAHVFSEHRVQRNKDLRSIQLFNSGGNAILKIYLKSNCIEQFNKIIAKYEVPYNYELQSDLETSSNKIDDNLLKLAMSSIKWNQTVPSKVYIKKNITSKGLLKRILQYIAKNNLDLGIYILGFSSIQYFEGKIHKLVDYKDWFNILDPEFNLQIKASILEKNIKIQYTKGHYNLFHITFADSTQNSILGLYSLGGNSYQISDMLQLHKGT